MAIAGDADISLVGALLSDRGRCRILFALGDGRALPASVLAAEAGVAPSTASEHLGRLAVAGLLTSERQGRHRYYRLAGPEVGRLLEVLAGLAPPAPVRSLRDATRAQRVRRARACYDHLAGRLGVGLMQALLRGRMLEGHDGSLVPGRERPASAGGAADYRLTAHGRRRLEELGVRLDRPSSRPLVRYCVDWSEQRHHLAGRLGAALAARLVELDWVRRDPRSRAVEVTDRGAGGLWRAFGLYWDSDGEGGSPVASNAGSPTLAR
jgi:DNA-binding transcriptional ArsR family regulator